MTGDQAHWDRRYTENDTTKLSWFQAQPEPSLELIREYGDSAGPLIDLGAGASSLTARLIRLGFEDITLLDISRAPLDEALSFLEEHKNRVKTIVADASKFVPERRYSTWHDRAVFHFLTNEEQKLGYLRALACGLAVGGHFVVGTFAKGGPEKCSGLPIVQYDVEAWRSLLKTTDLGEELELIHERQHTHITPASGEQRFQWCVFRRGKN